MSVYLALHTSGSPSIGDIAEFGETALRLGADPKQGLAVQRDQNGALTVVLPIPAAQERQTTARPAVRGEGDA